MNDDAQKAPQAYLAAHIDGGARGNPGPAGYGVVLEDEAGRPVAGLSEFLGTLNEMDAEYSGLLGALDYALKHGFTGLRVFSDSELMVKQIRGQYKVASPALKELYTQARTMIRQLGWFEITHVLREKNREADRLANVAMDRGSANKGSAHKRPAHNGPVIEAPAAVREVNGVVKDGVVRFLGSPLPEGTLVKVRPGKP